MKLTETMIKETMQTEGDILNRRYMDFDTPAGTVTCISKMAGSHNSGNSWGRITFRLNDDSISRAELEETLNNE